MDPAFESRRHQRHALSLPVIVTTGQSTQTGRLVNVSRGGMQVETHEPLDGRVRVRIASGDAGRAVVVRGTLVYTSKLGETWHSGINAGRGMNALVKQ
ncbi:MAG: PilZ domain-containing protein [Bacillota bacterium]|nr:PilZ domain-containing protein [Bacillota bacterium]